MEPGFAELDIHVDGAAERLVIRVSGEVDFATAPKLRQAVMEAVAGGAEEVVVDCGGIEFLSAAGLSVLVEAAQDLESRGGRIVLRSPTPFVRRLLDITRLDGLLERG